MSRSVRRSEPSERRPSVRLPRTHENADGVPIGAPRQRHIVAVLLGTARRAAQRRQLARRARGPDAERAARERCEAPAARRGGEREERLGCGRRGAVAAFVCAAGGVRRSGQPKPGCEVQALGDARRPVHGGWPAGCREEDVVASQPAVHFQAREAPCSGNTRRARRLAPRGGEARLLCRVRALWRAAPTLPADLFSVRLAGRPSSRVLRVLRSSSRHQEPNAKRMDGRAAAAASVDAGAVRAARQQLLLQAGAVVPPRSPAFRWPPHAALLAAQEHLVHDLGLDQPEGQAYARALAKALIGRLEEAVREAEARGEEAEVSRSQGGGEVSRTLMCHRSMVDCLRCMLSC